LVFYRDPGGVGGPPPLDELPENIVQSSSIPDTPSVPRRHGGGFSVVVHLAAGFRTLAVCETTRRALMEAP
jgi:hypothetical protein